MTICRFSTILFAILLGWQALPGQSLVAVSTKYNNDFNEWFVYTDSAKLVGTLNTRWPQKQDYAEWDYRIGEIFGSIRQKWLGDPSLWELRGGNELVMVQTIFPKDITQWRITYNNKTYEIKASYGNRWDEWQLLSRNGNYHMFTTSELDARDWDIEDGLTDESIHIRMAISFIVMYCGIVSNF